MSNRLAHESSPYLLQHQNNPVDWYPWGPEAIDKAKREDKPIFLSIGYAACHWCHVMEHESFENEPIAQYLNEHFVSIKVDREERPDLDQIYMNAVQIMTGRGGWPMSVFLTPDLKPFYGGTYWPPAPRMGMPGFEQILVAVVDAWRNRREAALKQAEEMTGYLQDIEQAEASGAPASGAPASGGREPPEATSQPISPADAQQLLDNAARTLRRAFDSRHGGFGSAPKFPHSMDLQLLLRLWKRQPAEDLLQMVTFTLDKMAAGGIYDHLAGGFARYSVDERWLVPHFEKMLYDNALLTSAYLDAFQATREPRFARIARETCDYVLRYMTGLEGGFHSTEDADSEGEEGKFYVWTPAEIKQLLGDEKGERFCYVYDVSESGNFEHGQSILNLPKTIEQCAALKKWDLAELQAELAESRTILLDARDRRVRPGKDDKVLLSWNALMIDALARAGALFEEQRYLAAAEQAVAFIFAHMRTTAGELLHTWRGGRAKITGFLDDYAYLIQALISLYEATFKEQYLHEASRAAANMRELFEDAPRGGFFYTSKSQEPLIARNKDLHDASVPSGNAMAATALIRLGKLTGNSGYVESAGRTLAAARSVMERSPTGAGQMLIALDLWRGPLRELVLIGGRNETENAELVKSIQRAYLPDAVLAYRPATPPQGAHAPRSPGEPAAELEPMFSGRSAADGQPTLYICENFACQAPVVGADAIRKALS